MATDDGRHDFDFLHGSWRVENRKRVNVLVPDAPEWEFEAFSRVETVLGGLGNIDTFTATLPDGTAYEAFTLRMFEPETGAWRIWSASSARPGILDVPVEGRFVDDRGCFECDDVLDGMPLRVRFEWTDITPVGARWQQAFSYDEGKSWQVNWTMVWQRVDGPLATTRS